MTSNYQYQERLRKQRENPETSRAGLKWEVEEDNALIDKVNEGLSFTEISKQLQRTVFRHLARSVQCPWKS